MSNSDYRNHPALARKLHAYLRWRNAQGSLPRHAAAQRRERARIRSERLPPDRRDAQVRPGHCTPVG